MSLRKGFVQSALLVLSLCALSASASASANDVCAFSYNPGKYDANGFAYSISDRDRKAVIGVLEVRADEIKSALASGEDFGWSFINPEGETVYIMPESHKERIRASLD